MTSARKSILRNRNGFSIVELLVTMVVFVFVIAAATAMFIPLMNQFKQQSKIAETATESIVGLEIMRVDIEHAGVGLPKSFQNNAINYSEAASAPEKAYNDNNTPTKVPRAILSGNNVGPLNNSDYLVIKSTVVATNAASQKWTYIRVPLTGPGAGVTFLKSWPPLPTSPVNLQAGNRVIVLDGTGGQIGFRQLIMNGTNYFTTFNTAFDANFSPKSNTGDTYVIYGVDDSSDLRMPFNRADYFVERPNTNMPARCAPGTGILYKATINHSDGKLSRLPLVDCVADMEIIFGLDTDGDGRIDRYSDDISVVTQFPPDAISKQVAEVRVYVLAQEGQKDPRYTYPSQTITIPPDPNDPGAGAGKPFDLKAAIGDPEYTYYRWKVYTLVVKPVNLKE